MSDLISRQAAIDALDMIGSVDTDADREYAREVFMSLPSAQPEIIRCKDCVNYLDERCLVANHHVAGFSCCLDVFGAERKGEQP